MKIERWSDTIADGMRTRGVIVELEPHEALLYDYQRLRPSRICLIWAWHNRHWTLAKVGLISDSVLKNGKLGKRRDVFLDIFENRPAQHEIEWLPAPLRHLIREHTPTRRPSRAFFGHVALSAR